MSDAQMTEGKKTSPWVYVAIGCGVLVMVFILVAAVAGFFVYRTVHRVHAEMTDPVLRAQKVKEILGARDLPEGYHPLMTFSIPFILETAMLSDREPDPDGKGKSFDQRGFIYIKTLQTHNEKKMRDYVDGKA